MRSLIVRCWTSTPVILYEPIMFDSILAWAVAVKEGLSIDNVKPIELPLAKLSVHDGWPLWACSALEPVNSVDDTIKYQKNNTWGEFSEKNKGFKPNVHSGRYQGRSIPYRGVIAAEWAAYCIGDKEKIANLLGNISHIGKRRQAGNGEIIKWSVNQSILSSDDIIVRDGELRRPLPVDDVVDKDGIPKYNFDSDPYSQGWTPPYWFGNNYKECYSIGCRIMED